MYNIRKAKLEDAKSIAHVHIESWKSTYQHLLQSKDIESIQLEHRITLWETVLKKSGQIVLVAENESGNIIGFISGGKERTKRFGYDGEIYAVYVLEQYHKKGIGTKLLQSFVKHMKKESFRSLLVWVLTKNEHKAFYERYGAAPVEAEEVTIGSGTYEETAYGWKSLRELENNIGLITK